METAEVATLRKVVVRTKSDRVRNEDSTMQSIEQK